MTKPKAAAKQRPSSGRRAKAAAPNAGQFKAGNPYAWKPGQSGNPGGARKGPRLSDLLHEALQAPMPHDRLTALQDLIDAGATIGEIIAWATALNATDGNLEAVNVIADRTEGAPDQTVHVHDLSTDDLAAARAKAQAWEAGRFPEPAIAATPAIAETAAPAAPAEAPNGQP